MSETKTSETVSIPETPRWGQVLPAKTPERTTDDDIRREQVIRELARIAFSDIRKMFNGDGSLKKITELDAETAAAISGVDVSTITKTSEDGEEFNAVLRKVKRADKTKALELLARIYGLVKDVNVEVNITLEALVMASFKKPE